MSKKILVVDDEPDVITYMTTFLNENGYETVTAGNGEEGLEKVKENNIDLVCLDIMMPKKSGVGFYRNIKKDDKAKNIPVIIVTGFRKDENPMMDFKKFLSERKTAPKPEGYIEKPIDRDELLKLIKGCIG